MNTDTSIELKNKFAKCPTCRNILDGATCCSDNEKKHPVKGDITICVYCSEILEYEEGCFLHKIPDERFIQINFDDPNAFRMIMAARDAVRDLRRNMKGYRT